ncbi:hypothetical protein KOI35_43565 [Actinoplanes bogorensis]|uniref:Uncharacterized protein n=1 Tax=Paractinoplanes bogorensis TaxID=1610840 RepID=A0ABS5Z3Z4_9ACTN|nr:hypothetical protein [Actinoplanes bogorensis]MBU2670403.1 hypothetical protein [Actinoplanes bogorensis]
MLSCMPFVRCARLAALSPATTKRADCTSRTSRHRPAISAVLATGLVLSIPAAARAEDGGARIRPADQPATAYMPVTPTRALLPVQVGPQKEVTFGVRGTNVAAVALDVAVARGRAGGGILAYPAGSRPPAVATNIHNPGQAVTQRLVVPIGRNGRITLRNQSSGSAHLAANLVGWYRVGAYQPVTPARVLETRGLKATTSLTFAVAGHAGVPRTAKTVLVNVSVNGVTSAGSLRLHGAGTVAPVSVIATHAAGQPGNATARVSLGTGGGLTVQNNARTSANVTVDVVGYLKS